jgi:hypothetical protein
MFLFVRNTCIAFPTHTEAAVFFRLYLFVTVPLCRYLSTLLHSPPSKHPQAKVKKQHRSSRGGGGGQAVTLSFAGRGNGGWLLNIVSIH